MIALQARVNGQLSHVIGSSVEAAVVSFGSGFVLLCVLVLLMPKVRLALRGLPAKVRSGSLAWWACIGGLGGGFFVAVQSYAVPLVGVAVFSVAIVGGQTTSSLAVDRAGLGPAGRAHVTPNRVIAAVLAVVAVSVAVSDKVGASLGSGATPAVLLALLAGAAIAVQQAINGRVSVASGQPLVAAWVNFAVGTAALVIALLVGLAAGGQVSPLPAGPWWMYSGGAIGVVFIAVAAWVVRPLGVLVFALLSVSGQLAGALLLDLLVPTPGASVGGRLVVGLLLTFVAVGIASARGSRRGAGTDGLTRRPR
jgi:transporter family-2 protein